MAQKKLLCILTFLVLYSSSAQSNECCRFKQDDLDFSQDIATRSREMALSEMKKKWLELENMLGSNYRLGGVDNEESENYKDTELGVSFRIFVSSSMSKHLLRSYAKIAKNYGAVLVFNGLPEGSWSKLSELVNEISENDPELVAMQIDDEAFKEFDIRRVPSFVLSKEEDMFLETSKITFDKISGSIGIRRALETFRDQGELGEIAQRKLGNGVAHE